MRLCRFSSDKELLQIGWYHDEVIIPLLPLAMHVGDSQLIESLQSTGGELLSYAIADSPGFLTLRKLELSIPAADLHQFAIPTHSVDILPPIAKPNKILLLAGNYAEHIVEQGGIASKREFTFPYVFSKPASTTLRGHNATVAIPQCSPHKIDYELELAVVIGKQAKNVCESEALQYVCGYTIINDLSDRGFRPNPSRKERPRDKFFDWLHGKWHDGFCPCGPCLTTSDAIPDPQSLKMELKVDDAVRQSATTGLQIFSVAEVIEFISRLVTLEPGDIISTGTPSGVANASGDFLLSGQRIDAWIEGIGNLTTWMVEEEL